MIIIPENRRWTQTNASDVFGTLYSTYNVNFDQEGYMQISPKSASIYSSDDNSDFKVPVAIVNYESAYIVITTGQPFKLAGGLAMTELTDSPPTDFGFASDAVVWKDKLVATTIDDLVSYDSGGTPDWTTGLIDVNSSTGGTQGLSNTVPHPLEVMGNFSGGHLVVGDGNKVYRLSALGSGTNPTATLTINDNYEITCLKYFDNNLYIGTRALDGGEAKVFVWNGSGTAAQAEYETGANWVFAMDEYKSSIIAVTSEGQLIRFTGAGFEVLANFPVYYSQYRWTSSTTRVQKRGIAVDGDIVYINIQGTVSHSEANDFFYLPNQPDGIWCYDPKVGLYCRHLSTIDKLTAVSVSSLSGDTLTLASSIKAETGEPVYLDDKGSLTGIDGNKTYYIIKISDDEIKLALTPANAKDGTAISLGGSAGTASVKVVGYNDYGYKYSEGDVGAIGLIRLNEGTPAIFPDITRTTIVWGYSFDSSTYHLNSLTSGRNIGGAVINKIWSPQVQDTFQNLFVKFANLNLDNDKIIIKARSKDTFGLPTQAVDGTYSTPSVLGSTSGHLNQAEVGHNINILAGNGAGQSVSITQIDNSEFHMDETLSNVSSSDAVVLNIDDFKKAGEVINSVQGFKGIKLDNNSSWLQIMMELRGQNVQIEELQLANTNKQPIA